MLGFRTTAGSTNTLMRITGKKSVPFGWPQLQMGLVCGLVSGILAALSLELPGALGQYTTCIHFRRPFTSLITLSKK